VAAHVVLTGLEPQVSARVQRVIVNGSEAGLAVPAAASQGSEAYAVTLCSGGGSPPVPVRAEMGGQPAVGATVGGEISTLDPDSDGDLGVPDTYDDLLLAPDCSVIYWDARGVSDPHGVAVVRVGGRESEVRW
jgi:hypothetical protein